MNDPLAERENGSASEVGTAFLQSIQRLVTREPSVDVALAEVARVLAEALSVDGCLIYRVETNGDLVVVAGHPALTGSEQPLRLPRGVGVTGRVAADEIPVVLFDDNPRNQLHRRLLGLAPGQLVSRLCVPARLPGGSCSAVLAVHSQAPRNFVESEVSLAQRVADIVGLRVQLAVVNASVAAYQSDGDALVAATVDAQEHERRRVARDLHDGVMQAIASLTFHLSAADVALGEGDIAYATDQVRTARSVADVAFEETRSAITGLHSPVLDDLGLAAGLVSLSRAIPNLNIEVHAQEVVLPDHVRTTLFRIVQEGIQNIVKHADAEKAIIRLDRQGSTVVLSITDDGGGFDAQGSLTDAPYGRSATAQYGLAGMAERVALIGGRLSITSRPESGTVVKVVVLVE